MHKNLEIIVESHRLASERRKAGKPVWDATVNIKGILHRDQDNTSDEHVRAVASEIAAELRRGLPASWLDGETMDWNLADMLDHLDAIAGDSSTPDFPLVDDLNNALASLYDWADIRRVWLG